MKILDRRGSNLFLCWLWASLTFISFSKICLFLVCPFLPPPFPGSLFSPPFPISSVTAICMQIVHYPVAGRRGQELTTGNQDQKKCSVAAPNISVERARGGWLGKKRKTRWEKGMKTTRGRKQMLEDLCNVTGESSMSPRTRIQNKWATRREFPLLIWFVLNLKNNSQWKSYQSRATHEAQSHCFGRSVHI